MLNINNIEANLPSRSRRKIDSIIENASKLFVQHGYHKVTMEGISQFANVSKVTLYKYFEDKQTLYEYILKLNYLNEYNQVVDVVDSDASFEAKVKEVVRIRIKKFYDKSTPIYQGEITLSKDLQEFIREYREKMKQYRFILYKEGRAQNYIKDTISDQSLELYFKVIQNGMVAVIKDFNDLDNEKFKQLMNILYAGILGCGY